MKKNAKKFLAMLLCLCMVAAVLPAGTPQASAAGETVTINFAEIPSANADVDNFTYNGNKVYHSGGVNYIDQGAHATPVLHKDGWFAFDVTVGEDGMYSTTMNNKTGMNNDSPWILYIIPSDELTAGQEVADITDRLKDDYKVMSATEAEARNTATLTGSTKALRKGNYKIVIKNDNGGTTPYSNATLGTYYLTHLVSFTLTKTGEYVDPDNVVFLDFRTGGSVSGTFNSLNANGKKVYNTGLNYVFGTNMSTMVLNDACWFAFDITVKTDGMYCPSAFQEVTNTYSSGYSVYLVPAGEINDATTDDDMKELLVEKNLLLTAPAVPNTAIQGTAKYTTEGENYPIKSGDYKIVIKQEEDRAITNVTYYQVQLSTFTLTRTGEYEEPTVDPIEMKFNSDTWAYQGTSLDSFKGNTNYTINKTATTATVKKVNNGNVAFAIAEDNELVINFDAEVAGDYKLVIGSAEHPDYGLNAEIWVNDERVGKIHNDNNASVAKDYPYNKGFGKVALTEGSNKIVIKGLAPDTIKSSSTETHRAGNVNFYVSQITFTPVGEEAVVKGIEISGDNTQATARVIMSDGSELTDADIVYGCVSDPAGAITVDATTGKITKNSAGRAVVEARYTDNNIVYQGQMQISVTNDDIFGNVYAYVEADGTVHFLGGLKKIEGYKQAGFYVFEGTEGSTWDMDMTVTSDKAVTTNQVYTAITTTDGNYEASHFGEDCGHIFYVSKEIAEGKTVVVRPFVVDEDDETVIYGKQYTMVVGQ